MAKPTLVLHTQAFVNGATAAGAKYVKAGISDSPETDLWLALGWPRMRFLVDGHPDGQLTDLAVLKEKIFDSYDDGVPTELASRRIRTLTAFMCDSDGSWRDGALKALKDDSPFTPESAATFIRENLASKAESMGLNNDVYALLEALVGPDVVLGAIVDALEEAPLKRLENDDRKLRWMVRWLSRLLLRVHVDRAPKLRARLSTLSRSLSEGRLADDFDQALHGPKSQQKTSSLVDISLWNDVPAATVIKAVEGLQLTRYSFSPEPRLVLLAGEPIVAFYRKKWNLLHEASDQRALVACFGRLRVPGIAALMTELAAKSKAKKQAQAWLDAHPELVDVRHTPVAVAAPKIAFKPLDPQQILAQLDAAVQGNDWADFFELNPEDCYHGMRLVAARNASDWGLVIERLQGCDSDSAQVKRWRFGSKVRGRASTTAMRRSRLPSTAMRWSAPKAGSP